MTAAKMSYQPGDNVFIQIKDNENGGFRFEPAKIIGLTTQNGYNAVEINWYYSGNSSMVLSNPRLYQSKIDAIIEKYKVSRDRLLILNKFDSQIVYSETINNRIKVYSDIHKHRKTLSYFHAFDEEVIDPKDTNSRTLQRPKINKQKSKKKIKDISYAPKQKIDHSKVYGVAQRNKGRNFMKSVQDKMQKGIKTIINLDDSDDDIEILQVQTMKNRPLKRKRKQNAVRSNPPKRRKVNPTKSVKSKAKALDGKESSNYYSKLLDCPIDANPNYLRLKKKSMQRQKKEKLINIFAYPHKASDHQRSPPNAIKLAQYVVKKQLRSDNFFVDVTPYKCFEDVCNHKLWTEHQTIFMNPPWSIPYYFISEGIKHKMRNNGNVIMLLQQSKALWWKKLIKPYCTLVVNLFGDAYGDYVRPYPLPTALVFVMNEETHKMYTKQIKVKKHNELFLGLNGCVDINEWIQTLSPRWRKYVDDCYTQKFVEFRTN